MASVTHSQRATIAAVVIGGSAGSVQILHAMLRALSPDIQVPIIVVIHLPPSASDLLPQVLATESALPVRFAEDKEVLQAGNVYIATPDYHLLVERGYTLALSMDDPVYYSRPSINVLFESARDAYNGDLLAILLSGASEDGAAGMQEIAAAGGVTIVQTPESAEVAVMPSSALELFTPTYTWSPARIAIELPRLLAVAAQTTDTDEHSS